MLAVGLVAVSVKAAPGTAEPARSPTRHWERPNTASSSPNGSEGSDGTRRENGIAPEKSRDATPGRPSGGCVRSRRAFSRKPSFTHTPSAASSSVLTLALPAGELFSIVNEWSVPSARSSTVPAARPPNGGALRIPLGGGIHATSPVPAAEDSESHRYSCGCIGVTSPSAQAQIARIGASGSR